MLTISCWGLQCKVLKLHKLRWFPFLKTKKQKQSLLIFYLHPSVIHIFSTSTYPAQIAACPATHRTSHQFLSHRANTHQQTGTLTPTQTGETCTLHKRGFQLASGDTPILKQSLLNIKITMKLMHIFSYWPNLFQMNWDWMIRKTYRK